MKCSCGSDAYQESGILKMWRCVRTGMSIKICQKMEALKS